MNKTIERSVPYPSSLVVRVAARSAARNKVGLSWVFRWILVQAKRWFLPVELKDLPAHGDKKGNESQKKSVCRCGSQFTNETQKDDRVTLATALNAAPRTRLKSLFGTPYLKILLIRVDSGGGWAIYYNIHVLAFCGQEAPAVYRPTRGEVSNFKLVLLVKGRTKVLAPFCSMRE
ncbi:hypothetical protein MGG_04723 [Pyricularia oryzae 70-15]|uniref:Uncharacterized protein n=4 Tax=Pyricularia TaxID=48558 RepID=A0ABQ8N7P3_PYRGI|nr:uncharacterized protein MGG_04723 [Pyricularia oryzae 70-15]ELQ42767.1 hypothetical protein OOU_Y34scaffold00194g80 [Pyricularia oryzae Y34]KAH8837382.1 hypothetical protein MCOR01_011008 [Pyricularia oryzae]KAI6292552.1 hypothetical protein MCOR33_009764 [Pyricularia grisea]EHA53887.1 hypothetical protein MGG_04723 [Pyricularia oryzae 70-15]KAI6252088.1 hypothetical protein MCOR19_011286 [Pyricularia oryzae]